MRTPRRRGADLQRVPPSPGGDAARARQHRGAQHRLPAAPLDLRPAAAELVGAPHFADDPCLQPDNYPLQTWNGLVFEGATAATSPPSWPARPDGRPRLQRLRARQACSCTSATTTGRPSSRSTSRTTTSRPFHPGLGQFVTCEDLRWEFGAHYSVQTVGREQRARPSRARRSTASGTTRCSRTATASRRSTARSGSPTTRT